MIELLRGKIASGKSFYAESRAKQGGACILRTDEITASLLEGVPCGGREKRVELEMRILRYFLSLAVSNHLAGIETVIDHGFWTGRECDFAFEFLEKAGVPFRFVCFEAPFERRLERAMKREHNRFDEEQLKHFDSFFELKELVNSVLVET